jgi:ribosomal protein S15P/S13E
MDLERLGGEETRMMSMARRIQKMEDRFMPTPQTESSRQLIERIEAGRRRVREYYEAHGLSEPSDEGLLPRKVHTSEGILRIIDILHEGRERSRLRSLRDEKDHPAA